MEIGVDDGTEIGKNVSGRKAVIAELGQIEGEQEQRQREVKFAGDTRKNNPNQLQRH
ncbi:MAG: hypothetical protein AAF223_10690 [Bacteroidota bacterium]